MKSLTLGIETSCDECSVSVVERLESHANPLPTWRVKSLSTHSQIKVHAEYGGVVPEIASRNHLESINLMIESALNQAEVTWEEIESIAVTNRPGLVGALLVGVSAAKTIAFALKKPLIPVHHLEGHALSLFLDPSDKIQSLQFPLLLAVVSGGHTNLYFLEKPPLEWRKDELSQSLIAHSLDDAAGEAFDKTAKILGFPYPGGKWIDEQAKLGNPNAFSLPRALPDKKILNFSFSGLKTAVLNQARKLESSSTLNNHLADLCASTQEAIIDHLTQKIFLAYKKMNAKSLAIVGGVSANSRLRERLHEKSIPCYFPEMRYCTDNGAMIAAAGSLRFQQGYFLNGNPLLQLNAIAHPTE